MSTFLRDVVLLNATWYLLLQRLNQCLLGYKLWQPSHAWRELQVTSRGTIIPPYPHRESYLGSPLSYISYTRVV